MDRRLFVRWALATWGGWVLGIPLVAALALVGEAARIGGAQLLVGAGMGAGIGLAQGLVVRRILRGWASWLGSCVAGLAAPFLATDIAKAAGWGLGYSLFACVAGGGLIVGVVQALLLRKSLRGWGWWIAASAAGWTLAAGTASIADSLIRSHSLRGLSGLFAYLGLVAAGGLLLGLVTGACLGLLPRRESAA